jgi:hypothetical protein
LMAQRFLDWWRAKDEGKKQLYFTLMSTRAIFYHADHVKAREARPSCRCPQKQSCVLFGPY